MSTRLADHLRAARQSRFVGRSAELALFDTALAQPTWPFHVLFLFGPGGIGKTTLLRAFGDRCDAAGVPLTYLDGRNLDGSPGGLIAALGEALNLAPSHDPLKALAEGGRSVVVLDTYESVAALDPWLRDVFLPLAPEQTLFLLAGRDAPSNAWRADAGWQAELRALPLRNLTPDESRMFLRERGVPPNQHDAVLAFTHGHALALSLVAEVFAQRADARFDPEGAPDMVRALLARFVQHVPGPAHRAALEACALVRTTTEALLSHLLGMPDVHELFEWLRDLSFVESGAEGLFPHDLAREALVTDLRWRNSNWYGELHYRARGYYSALLARSHGRQEQQDVLVSYVFLHRDNPVVRPFFDMLHAAPERGSSTRGGAVPDRLCEGDVPRIVAMVERHEGAEAGRLAAHWLDRFPSAFLVFRESLLDEPPVGVLCMLPIDAISDGDRFLDPAVAATRGYLDQHASLRAGERCTLFRFWMDGESYQDVSSVQSLIFVHMVRHYLTTPGLGFTFLPCANPDFWSALLGYADLHRLPDADFTVGDRCYGTYGHDWRAVPPSAWLDILGAREVTSASSVAEPPGADPILVLSEPEFRLAVRGGLRDFARQDLLASNPLTRSRCVMFRAGGGADTERRFVVFRGLLEDATESLRTSPRDEKLYRALDRTYLHPVGTQEQAAEELDLPFSTYRRHLVAGIERVAAILWRHETGIDSN